jgi:predicted ATPase/DNA-binding SARP family transcriptional activator
MRFGVLGQLEVWTAAGQPVAVRESKVRIVLAALLASEARPVSTAQLIECLWHDKVPAKPSASLHVKVSQLRRALDQAAPGGRQALVSTSSGYVLRIESEAVDFRHFDALVTKALSLQDPAERAGILAEALSLWRGAAFEEFADEPFARSHATSLEEQRLIAIEEHAHARLAIGDHQSLISELTELVEQHPLRERLWAAYLLALYRAGRSAEAVQLYSTLRDRLAEEFGAGPNPELVRLHAAMLQQDVTLEHVADQPKRVRSNLPVPLTGLLGRQDAVKDTVRRMAGNRLVTLVGAGGVGKTRLATAVANEPPVQPSDGVWLVELAQVPSSAESQSGVRVAEAVAAALGLVEEVVPGSSEQPLPSVTERLVAYLRGKQMLLVLDNCEHVVDQAADLVNTLLSASPGLRILATSRELLGVAGETLVEVPPLDLPEEGAPLGTITRSSAVELFLTRARAAAPNFNPRQQDMDTIAAICRRLDGLPLAIEMAATRVRALGTDQLLARLDDRLRLLDVERRGVPARQQTLRAMLDWSWGLCTEPEQAVLARLSLHATACHLEAAEAVCAHGLVAREDVLPLLSRLVDRSLLVVSEHGDHVRYRLLESVAEYCRERLRESGELAPTEDRYARYYTGLATQAEPALRGPDQRAWLDRLDADAANLERAMGVWLHLPSAENAFRHVNALAWYWFLRGKLGEGQRMMAAALKLDDTTGTRAETAVWHRAFTLLTTGTVPAGPEEPSESLGRARWFMAYSRWSVGAFAESEKINAVVLEHFRAEGDRWGVAAALVTQAALAMGRGDLAALNESAAKSAELFSALGDQWGQLKATDLLGGLAEIKGDYPRAVRLHEEGLRIAADLGLWSQTARKLAMLGRMALLAGDYKTADDLHTRSAALAAEQANMPWQVFAESGLAISARRQGRLDDAEEYLVRLMPWMQRMRAFNGLALVLAELGFVAEERGDWRTALEHHRRGLMAATYTEDLRAVALAFEGLAGAHRLGGHAADAARLLGAAAQIRSAIGAPLPAGEHHDVQRITVAAKEELGPEKFAACLAEGVAAEKARAAANARVEDAYGDLL